MNARRKQIAEGVEKSPPKEEPSPLAMTIGHFTRTLEEFFDLLQTYGAFWVVDGRTVSRSWHNPQFNKASLPGPVKKASLGYVYLPGLDGLRHANRESLNVGWRNACFRGYADYMRTPEFAQCLDELVQLANREQIELMCDEAVPRCCHRSFIADSLLVRGICTVDIMSPTRRQVDTLTPFAKVHGTAFSYPSEALGSTQKKPPAKHARTQSVAKISPEKMA